MPQHHGVLQPRHRVHDRLLHGRGQTHRHAVDVDLIHVHTFRLQKDLVPLLVREAHDLVFERRAIPGTDAGNLSVVERRLMDVPTHQIVDLCRRVNDVTGDLWRRDCGGLVRKRHHRIVAKVFGKPTEVDAPAIEARGSPGLEPPHLESKRAQRLRQMMRRRFTGAAGRALHITDVHQPVEKRARGHDQRATPDHVAVLKRETNDRSVFDEHLAGALKQPDDIWLRRQRVLHPRSVALLVGLRAWRPDSRAAAAVEQLELDPGGVDRQAHESTQRVDLADEMSFRGAADGRVARHQRDGVRRERTQADAASHPRGRPRRFAAGMTRPNHDDVKIRAHHFPIQK